MKRDRTKRNCRNRYSGENGIQNLPCREEKTNADGKHVLCFSEDGAESKPLIDSLDDLTPDQQWIYQFYGPGNEIYKPDWLDIEQPKLLLGEEADPSKPFKRTPFLRREPTPPKRKKQALVGKAPSPERKQTLTKKVALPKTKGPNSTSGENQKVEEELLQLHLQETKQEIPVPFFFLNESKEGSQTAPEARMEPEAAMEPEAPFMKEDMRIRRNPGKYNRQRDCNISNLKQLETALTSRYQNMPF